MARKLRTAVAAALLLPLVMVMTLLTAANPATAATLTRVTDFGANPTNLGMYVYAPDTVAPRPALLVLVHYRGGSAGAVFNGNGRDFVAAADRHGYVVVLPEATRDGRCFDVSTPAGLTRGGGSDSTGIMSEAIKQWTDLHGLSQVPSATDRPQASWTHTRYGDTSTPATVEGISIAGTGHTLPQPGMIAYAIAFLGLDGDNGGGSGTGEPSGPVLAGRTSNGRIDRPEPSTMKRGLPCSHVHLRDGAVSSGRPLPR